MGADPGVGVPLAEIEHMCAAAEGIDARTRAGVRPLKAPAAGEREGVGAAQDEVDDTLRVSGAVLPHPEFRASVSGIDRQEKAIRGRIVLRAVCAKLVVEIERTGGVVGCAHIEQAGEVCEIVSQGGLRKRKTPGAETGRCRVDGEGRGAARDRPASAYSAATG
jgi:hypothetical protein